MGLFLGKLLSSISWGTKDYGILMIGLDNAGVNSVNLDYVFLSILYIVGLSWFAM